MRTWLSGTATPGPSDNTDIHNTDIWAFFDGLEVSNRMKRHFTAHWCNCVTSHPEKAEPETTSAKIPSPGALTRGPQRCRAPAAVRAAPAAIQPVPTATISP